MTFKNVNFLKIVSISQKVNYRVHYLVTHSVHEVLEIILEKNYLFKIRTFLDT